MSKILAFPFFNEKEITEVKLATIAPLVDAILVVEGQQTFSGNPHEAQFGDFMRDNPIGKKYQKKIQYLQCDLSSAAPLARFGDLTAARWGRDVSLRNVLGDMAKANFKKSDVVILTDADEIPDPEWVESLDGLKCVEHTLMWRHCYHVNMRAPHPRLHEQVCRAFPVGLLNLMQMEDVARTQPDLVRGNENKGYGWHFTYMGGANNIVNKLHSFAHGEFDRSPYTDLSYVRECMYTGRDLFGRPYNDCVMVDDGELPEYLAANRDSPVFNNLWWSQNG